MTTLFTSLQLGRLTLRNRVVMAPMTRSRADEEGVPTDLVATYYAQRAGAGLIISEGVFPSSMGKGYVCTPGIDNDAQQGAWKKVTAAVHARGGLMFMQLMHAGRISHPAMLPGGALPVAPSAVQPAGKAWTMQGQLDFVTPRALATDEVAGVVAEYGNAARRAIEAGFDGVELHAASGYLPEQFLSSGTNQRDDAYGGSVENRARFVLEVLAAMIAAVGADRVGIKIAPEMGFNDIVDADPVATYTYLVDRLNTLGLAYLHVMRTASSTDYRALLRPRFDGVYLQGGGLTQASATEALAEGKADGAVFGATFLSNPDLVQRFAQGAPLNTPDPSTFYQGGATGYVDYPALAA